MNMNVQTKKNEETEITSDPTRMVGKFLAKPLLRTWKEDFIDEDSGEVVPIERSELIMQGGMLLDGDAVSQILFHIQSKEIKEVEVSNQRREGIFVKDSGVVVWNTVIDVNGKKVKLLLYANSAEMALEASRDFIELSYSGMCKTCSVKDFGSYILIDNPLIKDGDQEIESDSKKFYKFEVIITQGETVVNQRFVVFASDTDTAMIFIKDWIAKNQSERYSNTDEFMVAIETVTVVPCTHIIEKDFSEAYF